MDTTAPTAARGPLQRYTSTTPGRLRVLAAVCGVAIVVMLIFTTTTERSLSSTTNRVRSQSGPVLIATQQVFSSLAEADAAATAEYLAGKGDGREQRRMYEDALDRASRQIDVIAASIGNDASAHTALQDLLASITRYSGAIEATREKKALGAADADASLAAALAISSSQITPAVSRLIETTQSRITDDTGRVQFLAFALIALAALVITQLFIMRRMRRLVNVPLALATLCVLAATAWLYVAADRQQQDIASARTIGIDSIGLTGNIQATAYRAKAAESLALIGTTSNAEQFAIADKNAAALLNGNVTAAMVDAARTGKPLGATGLLADAQLHADSSREYASVAEILGRWQRYREASTAIRTAANASGGLTNARAIATTTGNSTFNGFNLAVENFLADNRSQFEARLDAAHDRLRGLQLGVIILLLIALFLSWWGVQLRWNEYR